MAVATIYQEDQIALHQVMNLLQMFGIGGEGDESKADRAARIVEEINSGKRTTTDLVQSLIRLADPEVARQAILGMMTSRGLEPTIGGNNPQVAAQQVINQIMNGKKFSEVQTEFNEQATDKSPGTDKVGDVTVPTGMRVVRVMNPKGSDAPALYYLVGRVYGHDISFEVGDSDEFIEIFGDDVQSTFGSMNTMTQAEFNRAGFIDQGNVDQILGSEESLQSQAERGVKELMGEDLPGWMRRDQEAMLLILTGNSQGWSAGKLWNELSKTQGFADRFGGALDIFKKQGVTIQESVSRLIAAEDQWRALLLYNDPNANTNINRLHRIMQKGWNIDVGAQVLEAGKAMRKDPEAMRQMNRVLRFKGLDPIDERGFAQVLLGTAPPKVLDAIAEASASQALINAGIEGVDMKLLTSVVKEFRGVRTTQDFTQIAQGLALNLLRFGSEINWHKMGLGRDDVIAAAFGENSPSGKGAGEVLNLLARFERDRQAAASGEGAPSSYIDNQGRLVVPSLAGL